MEDRVENVSQLFNKITPWVVFEIILVCAVAYAIIKASALILPRLAEFLPAALRQPTLIAVPIIRVLTLIVIVFIIIPLVFNVTLKNLIFVAGALSVAIGFALKDLSSSVIAGFIVLIEKPFRLGDWVRVGNDYGEVITIGMRAFQIRTPDDDTVTISHDHIWTHNIINTNNGADTLMCVANFHLAPDQNTQGVTDLLTGIARTSPYLNLDKGIIVVAENKSYGMTYQLKAYPFEPRDQFNFITDLTVRGNQALRSEGLQVASWPAVDVQRPEVTIERN